jgi:type IV pilus assembly protein PilW
VVVVAPEDRSVDCALAQISSAPTNAPFILLAGGASFRYNSGALGVNYRGGSTRVFNLGPAASLALHSYTVSNGFLQLRSTDMAGAGAAPATVADNIVSIKAQYGFDTRTGTAFDSRTSTRVNRWSATMINADGDAVTGGPGDYEHLAALRIAVVARSKTRETTVAGATCSATTSRPRVFASEEPVGVTAVPIDVDVAVAGDSVDWRCYRYRVFETIVPLRNANWRP